MQSNRTVLDYLDKQTALQPHAVAVADQFHSVTFQQLSAYSDALATYLLQHNILRQAVGVVAQHRVETIVLFLSVLKSGCFYVPLDPDLKSEKLAHICDNAGLSLALGCGEPITLPAGTAYLDCTQELLHGVSDFALLAALRSQLSSADPLYIIYTSGSTGVPKGVLKSHGAMLSYVETFTRQYALTSEDVLGNQTPFFFDASAKDLYWMLHDGCRLEILDGGLFSQPYKLIEYMNQRNVSVISWVPSALSIVTQLNTFADILPQHLRFVFFIGEVFPIKQFNAWQAALPQVRFVNLYGQSELAGACCYYEVQRHFSEEETLPIGTPLGNASIFLLNGSHCISQPNQVGEIGIVSPALADGYYNDPEKTAQAFVEFTHKGVTMRLFRTGDLAKYDENGLLVFAARQDAQIKHMGYRIELGEIEIAAASLPQVCQCACLYDKKKDKIVLFCTCTLSCTKADLRKALREKLSAYMVPSKIILLSQMPLNANGKIDRVSLSTYFA